jgi:hypothetical protein
VSWEIRIPFRSRDDSLADVAGAARHLGDKEEAAVVRQLVLDAALASHRTAGDLIDNLDRLSPAERRRVLDKAREGSGLESTEMVDGRRAVAAASATLPSHEPLRDHHGRTQAICAAKGCRNFEPDPISGAIALLPVRRWWCSAHRDQASPADSEPYRPRLGYSASGLVVDLDARDAEIAREAEREKGRRARREAREADQRAAAAQAAEDKRAERARLSREGRWQFPWGNS